MINEPTHVTYHINHYQPTIKTIGASTQRAEPIVAHVINRRSTTSQVAAAYRFGPKWHRPKWPRSSCRWSSPGRSIHRRSRNEVYIDDISKKSAEGCWRYIQKWGGTMVPPPWAPQQTTAIGEASGRYTIDSIECYRLTLQKWFQTSALSPVMPCDTHLGSQSPMITIDWATKNALTYHNGQSGAIPILIWL